VISIISVKKRFECSAVVKEDELQKNEKKWKTMENTLINLSIFFIVIKKLQKIGKNFCTDLIQTEIKDEIYNLDLIQNYPCLTYLQDIRMGT